MLAVSYNLFLLGGTVVLAIIAGFTGLSLASGLSRLSAVRRKPAIVRAAVVLGSGVWSTHFVAMLALQLPVDVVYDPVYTLASALLAILFTGAALLILHFSGRTNRHIAAAGTIMGLGVVSMHYVGMFGMRGCMPVYSVWGYVISTVLSAAICIGALHVAYRRRTLRGLMAGGTIYGLAILAMHFSAMSQTGFLPLDEIEPSVRMVPNDVLAMLVLFAAFLICGAFLLTTVTLREIAGGKQVTALANEEPLEPPPTEHDPEEEREPIPPAAKSAGEPVLRVPYEQDGRTFFAPIKDIVAIQADGHYTRLHRVSGPAFCPQPIARLADELAEAPFLRTHRSYLVNLTYVEGFERRKDQGVCLFATATGVGPVPVSRANVAATKAALGL
ncbi:MAG: MHYT domain-containing protein [Pseudomonadota bacterium]